MTTKSPNQLSSPTPCLFMCPALGPRVPGGRGRPTAEPPPRLCPPPGSAAPATHVPPPALAQRRCLPGVPLTPLTRSDLFSSVLVALDPSPLIANQRCNFTDFTLSLRDDLIKVCLPH